MRYIRQAVLQRRSLPMLLALAATGCAGGPPIVAAPSACAALLPETWQAPVPGAPLPANDMVAEWVAFGDAQTGQLDKANDRTSSAIGIVTRCEARDQAAIASARRPWWRFWR